jgi:hypothetical protein
MPSPTDRRHERWANLRHQIIGALLAAPPKRGELRASLETLAARTYRHPITGEPVQFAFSTLERWLHLARKASHGDTVRALRRKIRKDAGTRRAVSSVVVVAIVAQHKAHPTWSYKLHADNLVAQVVLGDLVGRVPSYTTVRSAASTARARAESTTTATTLRLPPHGHDGTSVAKTGATARPTDPAGTQRATRRRWLAGPNTPA